MEQVTNSWSSFINATEERADGLNIASSDFQKGGTVDWIDFFNQLIKLCFPNNTITRAWLIHYKTHIYNLIYKHWAEEYTYRTYIYKC